MMRESSPMLRTPFQINMVRTAIPYPDSPREVGDGMETEKQTVLPTPLNPLPHAVESPMSSGFSTPVFPVSARSEEKRLSVQVPPSPRSDDTRSLRDSIPSPVQLDSHFMKADRFLIEEKKALKDHLRIQVQVNQELKRLLVASIGEDMGFHYERIATEKAQIEIENEELKRKLLMQEEETERLNISCDVWRSKFLAGRVQCDELYETSIATQRRQRELDTAVRALLQEHRLRTEHLEEMRETLQHLHDALQWRRNTSDVTNGPKKGGFEGQIDEECLNLSHTISSHLLGSLKPTESKTSGYERYLHSWKKMTPKKTSSPHDIVYEVKPTMAEKYVTQLLQESGPRSASDAFNGGPSPRVHNRKYSAAVIGRFHPNANHDNLTLACCGRCTGDIHVV